MEHNIIPFIYAENEVRTLLDEEGEPWFVAKDVCDVLEHSNPSIAIQMLDDDERAKKSLGRQGDSWVINESGLYALIIRSNKPEAKPFRRWVTHDVLPSIRKHGSYETEEGGSDVMTRPQLAEVAFRVKQVAAMAKAFGFKGARRKLIVNDVVHGAIGIEPLKVLGVKDEVMREYETTRDETEEDSRLPSHASKHGKLNKEMLADFVEACCNVQAGLVESAARLYRRFSAWYAATYGTQQVPSQKTFGNMMAPHFKRFKSSTVYYRGIRLKEETAHLHGV